MEDSTEHDPVAEDSRVKHLRDLAGLDPLTIGARIKVDEDGWTYIYVGQITAEMNERLGWKQQRVWMPIHVLDGVITKHPVLLDPVEIATILLQQPETIHRSVRSPNERYFITRAERLRSQGLLASRSVRLVDAVVELRPVPNGEILRIFHLSPATRNKGGPQLWPEEQN